MKLIAKNISLPEIRQMAGRTFGNLVKAVVDVKKEVIAAGGELHADEEKYLLEQGSGQTDLWGINLYPDLTGDDFIEFDSLINIRPHQQNFTRGVEDPKVREKIIAIIDKLILK